MSLQISEIKEAPKTTRGNSRGANQSSPTHSGRKGSDLKKKGKASFMDKELIQLTKEGVIVHAPEHLSNFTIDKPKIDFFK